MALIDFWKKDFNKVKREWIDDGMGGGEWKLIEGESFEGLAVLGGSQSQILGAIRGEKEQYSLSTLEELDIDDFVKWQDKYLKINSKQNVSEADEQFILYKCESVNYDQL